MHSPKRLPGAELWIETNQSARSVRWIIEQLLEKLGHSPSDFEIVLG